MPDLEEAANTFARDLMTMNFAGLMTAFTPEGMMKAMAVQGQMLAQAQASGQPLPPPGAPPAADALPSAYELQVEPAEADDHPVLITMTSGRGSAAMRTVWREIEGAWKVNDMTLASLTASQPPAAAETVPESGAEQPPRG